MTSNASANLRAVSNRCTGFRLLAAVLCIWFASAGHGHAQWRTTGHDAEQSSVSPDVREMRLTVGEQKVLDSAEVRSYSESIKGIIDVRLTRDNSQFVVVALKPGTTTLLFIMLDGTEVHHEVTVHDPGRRPEASRSDEVAARDNIRLDFYFVSLSNSYAHQIGVGWPGDVGGGSTVNLGFDFLSEQLTNATAVVSQALPRLDMAQADGWAKVLRKAAVITANATHANFHGGGEVNVPVTGGFGGSIRQISFGSTIGVQPRYDKQTGRIELQITADVSDLVDDQGTGVPGRTISTLQTVVNLELGQSLVIAGLTAETERRNQAGLPLLSQIPILGGLFGSNSRHHNTTETVVFIVPSVVDTVSLQHRGLVEDALTAFKKFRGDTSKARTMPHTRSE